jgi:hypothetical protein
MALSPKQFFFNCSVFLRTFSLKDCKHKFVETFRNNSLPAKSLLHQIFSRFHAKVSKYESELKYVSV